MRPRTLVLISSALELATGLALIALPSLAANVLLAVPLAPSGEAVARLCGLGLFSLALACWPQGEGDHRQPIRALFFYNLTAAALLGYLRFSGEFTSHLLLPACALHALLALMLVRPAYRSLIRS